MADQPKIQLTYFTYPQLTQPEGLLPKDLGAQACWYYYTIAQSAKELIGESIEDQVILDDQQWMDTRFVAQAWAVAKLYGLRDPGEFLKYASVVWAQAAVMDGMPEPHPSYMNPIRGRIIH